jgi:hypothetical protein
MAGTTPADPDAAWPPLPLEAWRATKETLHRYCQMLGKVRLALVPFRNHWWHTTLYVDERGLTTGPMPVGDGRAAQVRLNLRDHAVELEDSSGDARRFALAQQPACAAFYEQLSTALTSLAVPAPIRPHPYDLDGPPFPDDYDNDTYDAEAATRYWRVLRATAGVLDEFAGWFNGKQSPVQLFWHSFDLALARFSGRRAPARPGAGLVEAEAYSHEVIAFGFWPGDDSVRYPAFYSYTAPAPNGLVDQPLEPAAAAWDHARGTARLPYDAVRQADDPRALLLAFCQSAYLAGARSAGWDVDDLATRAAPS